MRRIIAFVAALTIPLSCASPEGEPAAPQLGGLRKPQALDFEKLDHPEPCNQIGPPFVYPMSAE